MAGADNIALDAALFAPVTVIRSLAATEIVGFGAIDGSTTLDPVFRLEGAYKIEPDLSPTDAFDAYIDIVDETRLPLTNGVRVTLPREGGTVAAAAAGTINAVANLLYWQTTTGTTTWQNFAVNITLKDRAAPATVGWSLEIDPVGGSLNVGRIAALVLRGLSLRRTA